MKKKDSPFYNESIERALDQRAKEDLERKAMEKARNEYNYEQYMKKKERAEAKARNKIRRQNSRWPVIFLIVILLICLYVYLYQNGINLLKVIQSIYLSWKR
ncbi:hypothetical protein DW934_03370 [Blautia obeum]|jgi:hypothetical protein|uniref:Uncharacterized protein n=1 Tax=Blautia obeum TaxID=40520 RepID=A0A414JB78_9FIRM|nr:hypothetical protein [Blautia obeum]RHA50030.1 hypothetical protein DW934_03370 [Blautia obeum]RHE41820.1 hypothetical protein DW740_00425 [Blautia obeum]DAL36695.1 MAG TPA_asm: ATPase [Inoviridae sp.]